MKKIDAYLTRKAAAVWPGALVEDWDRTFLLQRAGRQAVILSGEPTPLPKRFKAAKEALLQAIAAEKATQQP